MHEQVRLFLLVFSLGWVMSRFDQITCFLWKPVRCAVLDGKFLLDQKEPDMVSRQFRIKGRVDPNSLFKHGRFRV